MATAKRNKKNWPTLLAKLRANELFWILLLLLAALALRLILFTGMARNDDLDYAHIAMDVVLGQFRIEDAINQPLTDDGWRFAFYLPVAAAYKLFGPTEFSTLLFPMASSLLGILFVYLIARELFDQGTALIAGFLWMLFPLDINLASDLMPDVPMTALSLGCVYFYLRGISSKQKTLFYFLIAMLMFVFAFLVKPYALLVFIFLVLHATFYYGKISNRYDALSRSAKRNLLFMVGGVFLVTCFAYIAYQQYFGWRFLQTSKDLIALFFGSRPGRFNPLDTENRLLFTLTPLAFFSFLNFLKRGENIFVIGWVAFTFAFIEWAPSRPGFFYSPTVPLSETRNFLLLFAPMMIVIAGFLSNQLSLERTRQIVGVSFLLIPVLGAIYRAQGFTGAVDFIVQSGVVISILGSFILVIYSSPKSSAPNLIAGALLLSLAIGMLSPTPPDHMTEPRFVNQIALQQNLKPIVHYLSNHPNLPILVFSDDMGINLNYVSNMEFGFSQNNQEGGPYRIRLSDPSANPNLSFFTTLYSDYKGEIPPGWWKVIESSFEETEPVYLYRYLNFTDSKIELSNAVLGVQESPGLESFYRLYGAAYNARSLSYLEIAWLEMRRQFGYKIPLVEMYPIVREIIEPQTDMQNLFINPEFVNSAEGWTTPADGILRSISGDESCESGVVLTLSQSTNIFRGLRQTLELKPNRIYYFETLLQSGAPARALRLNAVYEQAHDLTDDYLTWSYFATLFFVPDSTDQEVKIDIEIALIRSGQIRICEPALYELPGV